MPLEEVYARIKEEEIRNHKIVLKHFNRWRKDNPRLLGREEENGALQGFIQKELEAETIRNLRSGRSGPAEYAGTTEERSQKEKIQSLLDEFGKAYGSIGWRIDPEVRTQALRALQQLNGFNPAVVSETVINDYLGHYNSNAGKRTLIGFMEEFIKVSDESLLNKIQLDSYRLLLRVSSANRRRALLNIVTDMISKRKALHKYAFAEFEQELIRSMHEECGKRSRLPGSRCSPM